MAGLKSKLKAKICTRDLDPGDVVRVPDAKWAEYEHPVGGPGRWGIYVGRVRQRYLVRPSGADGVTGKAVEVDNVEHLDDVIQDVAIKEYYASRARTRPSRG